MKHMIMNAIGLVALTAMYGCSTVYNVSEMPSEPVQVRPLMRNPAASVKATPADESSRIVAAAIQSSVEGDLAKRGFAVNARGPVDSLVSLSVSRRETARLGDWRVYEGSADVQVSDASSGKLLGSSSFSAAGERSLDERKGEAAIIAKLSRDVTGWLAKTIPAKKVAVPPPPPGNAVSTLMIRPADPMEPSANVLRVQRRFLDAVSRHPGIVSCMLVGEAPERREFAFRVVYDPNAFPDGLLNTIVLDAPYLGDGARLEIAR